MQIKNSRPHLWGPQTQLVSVHTSSQTVRTRPSYLPPTAAGMNSNKAAHKNVHSHFLPESRENYMVSFSLSYWAEESFMLYFRLSSSSSSFFLIQNQMHFASSIRMSVSWEKRRWHSATVRWVVNEHSATARHRGKDTTFTSASNMVAGLMVQSCSLKGRQERDHQDIALKQCNYLKLSILRPLWTHSLKWIFYWFYYNDSQLQANQIGE